MSYEDRRDERYKMIGQLSFEEFVADGRSDGIYKHHSPDCVKWVGMYALSQHEASCKKCQSPRMIGPLCRTYTAIFKEHGHHCSCGNRPEWSSTPDTGIVGKLKPSDN